MLNLTRWLYITVHGRQPVRRQPRPHRERFQEVHGLKIGSLIRDLNDEWRESNERRKSS